MQIQKINQPDLIGAMASGLCALHCMATPFLFLIQAQSAICCSEKPFWWQPIDYLFLIVSFFAIYSTVKSTSKSWIKVAFWGVWALLLVAVVNETLEIVQIPELFVYTPALGLVVLHLYNQKYCKCMGDSCCSN